MNTKRFLGISLFLLIVMMVIGVLLAPQGSAQGITSIDLGWHNISQLGPFLWLVATRLLMAMVIFQCRFMLWQKLLGFPGYTNLRHEIDKSDNDSHAIMVFGLTISSLLLSLTTPRPELWAYITDSLFRVPLALMIELLLVTAIAWIIGIGSIDSFNEKLHEPRNNSHALIIAGVGIGISLFIALLVT